MKKLALLLICTLVLCGCKEKASEVASSEISEAAHTSTVVFEAFNSKNAEALAPLLAPDALFVNFTTGEIATGPKEIQSYFSKQFPLIKNLQILSKGVRIKSATIAIEKGAAKLAEGGKDSKHLIWKAEYGKNDGTWQLQKLSIVILQAPHTNYNQLKELSWLLGRWASNDADGISVQLRCKWDNNKNFLLQRFSMKILDERQVSGLQIIGWNPANKQICSWTYDSEGGIGKSTWHKRGSSWYAKTLYILPDGQKASVTHVYKMINDTTYLFSAENREIDGKVLPNVGPYKIVKASRGAS